MVMLNAVVHEGQFSRNCLVTNTFKSKWVKYCYFLLLDVLSTLQMSTSL